MSEAHLSSIDLNLLLHLQALLEERNVTKAGKRVHLTQSAMSRSLDRLRFVLKDELLVRSRNGYELTAKGEALFRELETLVPRLEAFWKGEPFTPGMHSGEVRVLMTDQAAAVFLPQLMRRLREEAPRLVPKILPYAIDPWSDLIAGRVDLVLSPVAAPAPLCVEEVYTERFVCLVSRQHAWKQKAFTLAQYVQQQHVAVETDRLGQTLIERPLAERGQRRSIALKLPYFMPAAFVAAATDLVLTCPSPFAQTLSRRWDLRQIAAPKEIALFPYSFIWHPRHTHEDLHAWFRKLLRSVIKQEISS